MIFIYKQTLNKSVSWCTAQRANIRSLAHTIYKWASEKQTDERATTQTHVHSKQVLVRANDKPSSSSLFCCRIFDRSGTGPCHTYKRLSDSDIWKHKTLFFSSSKTFILIYSNNFFKFCVISFLNNKTSLYLLTWMIF